MKHIFSIFLILFTLSISAQNVDNDNLILVTVAGVDKIINQQDYSHAFRNGSSGTILVPPFRTNGRRNGKFKVVVDQTLEDLLDATCGNWALFQESKVEFQSNPIDGRDVAINKRFISDIVPWASNSSGSVIIIKEPRLKIWVNKTVQDIAAECLGCSIAGSGTDSDSKITAINFDSRSTLPSGVIVDTYEVTVTDENNVDSYFSFDIGHPIDKDCQGAFAPTMGSICKGDALEIYTSGFYFVDGVVQMANIDVAIGGTTYTATTTGNSNLTIPYDVAWETIVNPQVRLGYSLGSSCGFKTYLPITIYDCAANLDLCTSLQNITDNGNTVLNTDKVLVKQADNSCEVKSLKTYSVDRVFAEEISGEFEIEYNNNSISIDIDDYISNSVFDYQLFQKDFSSLLSTINLKWLGWSDQTDFTYDENIPGITSFEFLIGKINDGLSVIYDGSDVEGNIEQSYLNILDWVSVTSDNITTTSLNYLNSGNVETFNFVTPAESEVTYCRDHVFAEEFFDSIGIDYGGQSISVDVSDFINNSILDVTSFESELVNKFRSIGLEFVGWGEGTDLTYVAEDGFVTSLLMHVIREDNGTVPLYDNADWGDLDETICGFTSYESINTNNNIVTHYYYPDSSNNESLITSIVLQNSCDCPCDYYQVQIDDENLENNAVLSLRWLGSTNTIDLNSDINWLNPDHSGQLMSLISGIGLPFDIHYINLNRIIDNNGDDIIKLSLLIGASYDHFTSSAISSWEDNLPINVDIDTDFGLTYNKNSSPFCSDYYSPILSTSKFEVTCNCVVDEVNIEDYTVGSISDNCTEFEETLSGNLAYSYWVTGTQIGTFLDDASNTISLKKTNSTSTGILSLWSSTAFENTIPVIENSILNSFVTASFAGDYTVSITNFSTQILTDVLTGDDYEEVSFDLTVNITNPTLDTYWLGFQGNGSTTSVQFNCINGQINYDYGDFILGLEDCNGDMVTWSDAVIKVDSTNELILIPNNNSVGIFYTGTNPSETFTIISLNNNSNCKFEYYQFSN